MTNAEKVREFMLKFGFPAHNHPGVINDKDFLFRYQLCLEEIEELLQSHRAKNIIGIADALADLLYVTYGLAHYYGIPIDDVFEEVHRANMEKVRGVGKRESEIDVVKPGGWQEPDLRRVIYK